MLKPRSGLFLFSLLLMHAIDVHAQWIQTAGPYNGNGGMTSMDVRVLAVSPNGRGGTNLFAANDYGIFLSTNDGASWTVVTGYMYYGPTPHVNSIAVSGRNLFAATSEGLFVSTNNGANWTFPTSTFQGGDNWPPNAIRALAVSDSTLFAMVATWSLPYRSTDVGKSWTESGIVPFTQYAERISALTVAGTAILAGTRNLFAGTSAGLYLSTSDGLGWTALNFGLANYSVSAESDTSLFAWGDGGVFHSTNNGASWSAVNSGLTNTHVNAFAVTEMNLFAGTDRGVYFSNNSGSSWTPVNIGLADLSVKSLAVGGPYLFAGGASGFVSRRFITEMLTAVEDNVSQIPDHFALDQNYPNPFNPATTISFSLPSQSFVSLKVFDALGREVTTLGSGEMSAGSHSMRWNASNVPSGVYYYRLQAGEYVETKKMVLLR